MEARTIGGKIAKARKKISISQAQLAERLFISPQAVGKWERGESLPDIITVNRLAEILGVDLNYFSESSETLSSSGEVLANQVTASSSGERNPIADKKGRELSWDLSRENLVDTDFSGLKNLHEKLSSSNMLRCLFIGSDLSGLLLKSSNVEGCDFSGSDITGSRIQGSNLSNNIFKNCSLKEIECERSFLDGCDFSGTNFTGARFKSAGFGNNTTVDAMWDHTSFIDTYIADIVFEGTLEDCHFEKCVFNKVTFQNATLTSTFFKHNKRLNKLRFINCKADKLTYAFLKNGKADLSGITLVNTLGG